MGMSTQKLTIFDTINRIKKQIQANPNRVVLSASEVGDIAEWAQLQPVPVREKTQVAWYRQSDVVAAIKKFEADQVRYRALTEMQNNTPEPVTIAENEPISLAESGTLDNLIPETEPKQGDDPAVEAITDDSQATDGPAQAGSFDAMGFDKGLVDALERNGITTPAALQNLVDSSGPESLKTLDGIGDGRIKTIEKALNLNPA